MTIEADSMTVFDASSMSPGNWRSIDDPVMGGESRSVMQPGPAGTAWFTGTVSLANNGGFAAVHRSLEPGLLSGYDALALRIRGDGRRYSLRLRQDSDFDGISYRQDFLTGDGEWETVLLSLSAFEAVFRGRHLPTAGALERSRVNRIGLLIARQPGPFRLQLRWIRAVRGCVPGRGGKA